MLCLVLASVRQTFWLLFRPIVVGLPRLNLREAPCVGTTADKYNSELQIGMVILKSRNWLLIFLLCALAGVLLGYVAALYLKPELIPPALRFGFLREPRVVLLLGTDVVYEGRGRSLKANQKSFSGRSDTIMVARLDPIQNSFGVLSIPRDTAVRIPGHGKQKINAANALGGPELACKTVSQLLHLPVDNYVVLNVQGLVHLVDELGGIEITVPKRMKYSDKSAKLTIDLQAGPNKLSGEQAMGFVRFRHDELGDIGRVQRQEMFIRALLDSAAQPSSWAHVPQLIEIAGDFITTDLKPSEIATMAAFVKAVPKQNQLLVMLPGRFSPSGDWQVNYKELTRVVAKMSGGSFIESSRRKLRVTVQNQSDDEQLDDLLREFLRDKGYRRVRTKHVRKSRRDETVLATSKIIAQKGNPEDAELVRGDLQGRGRDSQRLGRRHRELGDNHGW